MREIFYGFRFFCIFLSGFCGLISCYNIHHFEEKISTILDTSVLESAVLNIRKNASLITLTKSSTENDRNLTTKVIATRGDDEEKKGEAEVPGEKVWRNYSFFEARRLDYTWRR